MNKARLVLLNYAWEKEWGKMLSIISKVKKPTKKMKELQVDLEKITDDAKYQVIAAYH